MNCVEWEERIALAAGGDLSDPATDRHLADCPGCQLLLSGLRQTLSDLRDAPDEIAPAHYAALRARVLAEVARPRRRRWLWLAPVPLAAVFLWPLPKVEPLPMRAIAAPPAPIVTIPKKRKPKLTKPEPLLVKIETDNPDVVIYWIAETKGEDPK
jgi:anti-sigma factor RsiW